MSLETCDALWFASLANSVDSVADSDLCLHWFELLVQRNQHARVDGKRQVEQEVVVFANDEGLHVGCAEQNGQETSQGHIIEQELLAVQWVKSKKTLSRKKNKN